MNLRLLQSYWLFYLVVKEESFTKAASIASMSQPPLSMHIKKLEDSLGVKLFERTNKKVTLTKEGKAILPLVEKFLDRTEEFFEEIQANLNGLEEKFTVGSFAWLLQLFIAPMLGGLKQLYPHKHYDFVELESIDLTSMLKDFKIDVGYAYAEPFERVGIETVNVAYIENKVVLPKSHPLTKQESVRLEQLKGMNCICLPSDVSSQLFNFMKEQGNHFGFNIISRADIRTFYNQVTYVESQLAFAIVAAPACELISKNVKTIPIEDSPLLTLARMTRNDLSLKSRKKLIELEKEYLAKIPGISLIPGNS